MTENRMEEAGPRGKSAYPGQPPYPGQQHPDHPPYLSEAVYLAESYTAMLQHCEAMAKRLAGSWIYTKEMAIADLDNLSVSYDGDHVQSSNISNPTERIALKLTPEYLAGKQAEMDRERAWLLREKEYVDWKIEVVETVMRERLSEDQHNVFKLLYIGHRTYREAEDVLWKKRNRKVTNRGLAQIKEQIREKIRSELTMRSQLSEDAFFLKWLEKEVKVDAGESG